MGNPGLISESEIRCVAAARGVIDEPRADKQGESELISESEISHTARTLDLFERRFVKIGDKHTDSADKSAGVKSQNAQLESEYQR